MRPAAALKTTVAAEDSPTAQRTKRLGLVGGGPGLRNNGCEQTNL